MSAEKIIKKCTPAVSRHWLFLTAGIVWSTVGTALCVMACYWLSGMDGLTSEIGATAGFFGGVIIYAYGFSRIAWKNADRLVQKPESLCLFAFQAWRSYFLILFMIVLGYTIRHSSLPKIIVALVYLAIGTGLALSSSIYYRSFWSTGHSRSAFRT